MNKGVLLNKGLAERTKSLVETFTGSGPPPADPQIRAQVAATVIPVEITTGWERDEENGWTASFRKLRFQKADGLYDLNENDEREAILHYPLSSGKPPGGTGSRAFAVYR